MRIHLRSKIIQYDENGKKTREEDLGPEDQKDFEKNFGDELGLGELPGGPGVGRDVLVGLDAPEGAPEPVEPDFA